MLISKYTNTRTTKPGKKPLTTRQMSILQCYRTGGAWTPTRRYSRVSAQQSPDTYGPIATECKCPWCPAPLCSLTHLVKICPHFAARRRELNLTPEILNALPPAALKSGWIPHYAATAKKDRAQLQQRICAMAVSALQQLYNEPDAEG